VIVGETDGHGKWSALNESLPGRIFISYRRQETAWPAGRLYDVLVEHFPAEQVFKDVDNIEPGEDFVERITAAVESCDVLLALIGPQWLTITDENGQRRLDNSEDYVRLEIETALTRKIRVIPILVDDARMPRVTELPSILGPLVRRNAVEINPAGFNTERLITAVHKALAEEQARRDAEEQAQREEAEDSADDECAGPPAAGGTVEVTEPEPEEALGKGASEVSEAGPDQPAGSSREPRFTSRRTKVLGTIAVVVVAASAGWLLIRSEPEDPGKAPTVAVTPNTSSPPTSTTTAPGPAVPQAAAPLPKNVIVFPEGTKNNEDIWTVRADGSGRKLLVGNPGTDTWPVISHDRKTVLYVHIENGGQTLRMVSVDGQDDRVFADVDSICKLTSRPAWSSTGMIAVVCVEGPRIHSIKLVNTDGTVEGTLVPPVDYVEDPAFSDDGKFVVYWKQPSTNELEGGPLYRIGVDGQGERRITDGEPGQDADPAWSPDDDRIAFRRRADRESARDIWIYNVRTGESKALVTGPSNDQDPSWSPDGRHLVYKCGPNGDAEICIVDSDGKKPHRLFQSDEPNTAPAWTPR